MDEIIIKSEIYITFESVEYSRVKIYSHVKQEEVYNGITGNPDVIPLIEDLQVNPGNTIIRMSQHHSLTPAFEAAGYTVKYYLFT